MNPSRGGLLWENWCRQAELKPERDAVVHWMAGEEPGRWSYQKLVRVATQTAIRLRGQGIKPGDVCALIIRHHLDFYPLYMAVVALGAVPTVLPYPNDRIHPDKFAEGLTGMIERSGLDWIFTEPEIKEKLAPLLPLARRKSPGLLLIDIWSSRAEPTEPEFHRYLSEINAWRAGFNAGDICLLQHSSGTTGLQKGVALSHEAVLGHVDSYAEAIALSDIDKVVSWLPLYHDMGLIAAFHLPLACGLTTVQIDPFQWVLYPFLMMEAIAKEKGTLAWMPNFAFNFMVNQIHEEDIESLSLSSIRLLINCSEPIRAESQDLFQARFQPHGLAPHVLSTCYAMAETTFALTQSIPGRTPTEILLDRESLAHGRVVPADLGPGTKRCLSSGRPIRGCRLRITDEVGVDVPAGSVGEILVQSPGLFTGYLNAPELTREVFADGWYRTGDFGFVVDGDYFIVGRKKDIIIVAGKNIYPEDIEDALTNVPGVIPGRVVAYGEEDAELGTERIAVICETSLTGEAECGALEGKIREAGAELGHTISVVHLVPPRWLIKSSSGKLSRKANKERAARRSRVAPARETKLPKEAI